MTALYCPKYGVEEWELPDRGECRVAHALLPIGAIARGDPLPERPIERDDCVFRARNEADVQRYCATHREHRDDGGGLRP